MEFSNGMENPHSKGTVSSVLPHRRERPNLSLFASLSCGKRTLCMFAFCGCRSFFLEKKLNSFPEKIRHILRVQTNVIERLQRQEVKFGKMYCASPRDNGCELLPSPVSTRHRKRNDRALSSCATKEKKTREERVRQKPIYAFSGS